LWWRWRLQLTHFEIIDALGAFELISREGTLGGSVPLRAAQACAPLLEGNAFGLQLRAREPLLLRKGLRALRAPESFVVQCRAMAPVLVARGLLSAADAKLAAHGIIRRAGTDWLFTGLLARPAQGLSGMILPGAARTSRALGVQALELPAGQWTPIFLRLSLRSGLPSAVLEGDVATLAAFPERSLPVNNASTKDRQAMLRAHVGFYDARYFEDKKRGKVTRKYKKLVHGAHLDEVEAGAVTVAHLGPNLLAERDGALQVHAAFAFSARYDGGAVHVSAAEAHRARFASVVRAVVDPLLRDLGHEHQGALLYLSKYFTPHPPGEPYFFVKPPALIRTPPGWSSVIFGQSFASCEVLRGVVHTDQFYALPQVFHVFEPFRDARIAQDELLCTVRALPRSLLRPKASVQPIGL